MQRQRVELAGRPIGRLRASWLLFTETFRFFRADPELFWVPVLAAIVNLLVLGVILVVLISGVLVSGVDPEAGDTTRYFEYAFVIIAYIVGAYILALAEAAIARVVSTRARGGDATFGDGLAAAFAHARALFIWALITSTVGLVLRFISERSQLLGRLVASLLGVAWAVLTYFVVPSIVLEGSSATDAIRRSGAVFRGTWGELVVANFGVGLIFVLGHVLLLVAGVGLMLGAAASGSGALALVILVLYLVLAVVLVVLQQCFAGILKTLLFIYAVDAVPPANFNPELLEKMLARKQEDPQSS